MTPSLRVLLLLQLFTFGITGGYRARGLIPTLSSFFKIAANRVDKPFSSWGKELYEGFDEERRKAVRWAQFVVAFHAGIVILSLAIGQPILILLISGGVFIANFYHYFIAVPMHCGLRSRTNDFRKCARTITLDPISEFLYWHSNWHLEHHMFASVPCYNLKSLHKVVAHDMPEPRTVTSAWCEMRATWHRQIDDPEYEYDTPLPVSENKISDTTDPLATSTGRLGPAILQSRFDVSHRKGSPQAQ